jgi:hypothetical protein
MLAACAAVKFIWDSLAGAHEPADKRMLSVAYIAGFFDGEGSIGVYHGIKGGRSDRFHLRTQVTQNCSTESTSLINDLRKMYGGSCNVMDRTASRLAYNWQLNGHRAAHFLGSMLPYLRLKRDQAQFAMAWQRKRPPVIRNAHGHIVYKEQPVLVFDERVARLIKMLKVTSLQEVMANHAELVEVVRALGQENCVNGS